MTQPQPIRGHIALMSWYPVANSIVIVGRTGKAAFFSFFAMQVHITLVTPPAHIFSDLLVPYLWFCYLALVH